MKRLYPIGMLMSGILASTLGTILFVALWPYLDILGKLLIGFLAVLIGCATFLLVAWTYHRFALMMLHRHNHVIAVDGVVVLIRDGEVTHLSAQQAEAGRPLMLPPPVKVTEEKASPDRSQQEADILELHSHGSSFKSIAQAYKDAGDTYWTEYRVRQLCNAHKQAQLID